MRIQEFMRKMDTSAISLTTCMISFDLNMIANGIMHAKKRKFISIRSFWIRFAFYQVVSPSIN